MEKVIVQRDNADLRQVDAFIGGICDEFHIDNYYATISVAVTKSVEIALSCGGNFSSNADVQVIFAYSPHGILFTVVNSTECFNENNEAMMLPFMLADKVVVSNNKSAVQLFFSVRGIDAGEASRRVSVLNQYYKVTEDKKVHV